MDVYVILVITDEFYHIIKAIHSQSLSKESILE
jgi:hypothetical protein